MASQYENQLIEVLVEDETNHTSKCVARIDRRQDESTYVVTYLSFTGELYEDYCKIYDYENNTSLVEEESISQWFDTKDEERVGFKKLFKNTYITQEDWEDMDEDYNPSGSSEGSEDESLIDSDDFNDDDSDSDTDTGKQKPAIKTT